MDAFERLVIVNRFNVPEAIDFCFPLELSIDKRWCEETSRSITGNQKWQMFEATESLADQLPARAGLYMFVWRIPFPFPTERLAKHYFRVVVYIGQAGAQSSGNTLKQRYKQEYAAIVNSDPQLLWGSDSANRESRLSRFLNLRDLEFWFHEVLQTDLLSAFEESLIKVFNPPANSQFVQRRSATPVQARIGRAIPAF